jgi:hypothetical protein
MAEEDPVAGEEAEAQAEDGVFNKPDREEQYTTVTESAQNRLAVLIDADNAQPLIMEGLLSEVSKYGVVSV